MADVSTKQTSDIACHWRECIVSTYDVAQTAAPAVAARAAVEEAAESVRDDGGGGY